jgi:hypothetical protein
MELKINRGSGIKKLTIIREGKGKEESKRDQMKHE